MHDFLFFPICKSGSIVIFGPLTFFLMVSCILLFCSNENGITYEIEDPMKQCTHYILEKWFPLQGERAQSLKKF